MRFDAPDREWPCSGCLYYSTPAHVPLTSHCQANRKDWGDGAKWQDRQFFLNLALVTRGWFLA